MNNPSNIAMRRRLYAIRDDKQGEFNAPVSIPNDAVASRSFGDSLSDKNNPITRHPSDYSLWYLGDYDAETGVLVQDTKPYIVAHASDFLNGVSDNA